MKRYFQLTSYDRFASHKALLDGVIHVHVGIYEQKIHSMVFYRSLVQTCRKHCETNSFLSQSIWNVPRDKFQSHCNDCAIEIKETRPTISARSIKLNHFIWFFFFLSVHSKRRSIPDAQIKNRNKDGKHNNNNKMKWFNHITSEREKTINSGVMRMRDVLLLRFQNIDQNGWIS